MSTAKRTKTETGTAATQAKQSARTGTKKAAQESPAGKTEASAKTRALLNLREGPDTSAPVLKVLERGESLTMTGEVKNGFAEAKDSAGVTGWVMLQYIEVSGFD